LIVPNIDLYLKFLILLPKMYFQYSVKTYELFNTNSRTVMYVEIMIYQLSIGYGPASCAHFVVVSPAGIVSK